MQGNLKCYGSLVLIYTNMLKGVQKKVYVPRATLLRFLRQMFMFMCTHFKKNV